MDGVVQWWNDKKGYGFIADEDGTDYFVHHSEVRMQGFVCLEADEFVSFEPGVSPQGEPEALNVVKRDAEFTGEKSVVLLYSSGDEKTVLRFLFSLRIRNIDACLVNENNLRDEEEEEEEEDYDDDDDREDEPVLPEDVISDVDMIAVCVSSEAVNDPEFHAAIDQVMPHAVKKGLPCFVLKIDACRPPAMWNHCEALNLFEPGGFKSAALRLEQAFL